MLPLCPPSSALATANRHRKATCPSAKYGAVHRHASSSAGWRQADVAVEAVAPSTSYYVASVPRSCWRQQRKPSGSERCIATLALPTTEGNLQTDGNGKVGVVIVDHGSRKKASNDMLVEFGDLYGRVTGTEIVEIAHMEIASPTIEEAVGRCAARGAHKVVIAPYFLSRGRHIQEDIPALVREAQDRHPGLRCVIADPIGIDVLMVQLISNRVAAALGNVAAAPAAPAEVAVPAAAVKSEAA